MNTNTYDCYICGQNTQHYYNGLFICFDCICDIQEGESERIQQSVKDFRGDPKNDKIPDILYRVSQVTKIPVEKIHIKTRKREIVEARHIAMHIALLNNCGSLAFIGSQIGNKDHSTVIHANKTVKNLLETNAIFRDKFGELVNLYS